MAAQAPSKGTIKPGKNFLRKPQTLSYMCVVFLGFSFFLLSCTMRKETRAKESVKETSSGDFGKKGEAGDLEIASTTLAWLLGCGICTLNSAADSGSLIRKHGCQPFLQGPTTPETPSHNHQKALGRSWLHFRHMYQGLLTPGHLVRRVRNF